MRLFPCKTPKKSQSESAKISRPQIMFEIARQSFSFQHKTLGEIVKKIIHEVIKKRNSILSLPASSYAANILRRKGLQMDPVFAIFSPSVCNHGFHSLKFAHLTNQCWLAVICQARGKYYSVKLRGKYSSKGRWKLTKIISSFFYTIVSYLTVVQTAKCINECGQLRGLPWPLQFGCLLLLLLKDKVFTSSFFDTCLFLGVEVQNINKNTNKQRFFQQSFKLCHAIWHKFCSCKNNFTPLHP